MDIPRDSRYRSRGILTGVTAIVGFRLTERVFMGFAAALFSRTVIQPIFQGSMEIIESSYLLFCVRNQGVRYTDRVSGLL